MSGLVALPLRRGLWAVASFAVLGGCAMQVGDEPVTQTSEAQSICATGAVVQGIDVSSYQGSIDWTSVKAAGMDFAIARISDGSALDSDFATNWTGMKSAGLIRGAYQYFEPGQDPTSQAQIVVSAVGVLDAGDLPVTADMEATGGQSAATIAANLQTWMTAVQAGTGKAPMVYTASGYWNSDVASSAFANNPLWVANWGATCPSMPSGWSSWIFWQTNDTGSVSGISGAVDTDEFNGSLTALQAFAGGMGTVSDGGTSGTYGAKYVSQSWPLASTTMMMTTCQTVAATITLQNVGTLPWDSNTRLATTNPRNRVSEFGDSTWTSDNRAEAVTGTVLPGGMFEFKFDFHAPPTTGTFQEYFGLVEEGVAWFGDPGQDGPPDNDIEANIQVTAGSTNCTVDPGVPDGGMAKADAGAPGSDGGVVATLDAGHPAADSGSSSGAPDAQADAATLSFDDPGHGCGCATVGVDGPSTWAFGVLGAIVASVARRRRGARSGCATLDG
jgi:lysozyme